MAAGAGASAGAAATTAGVARMANIRVCAHLRSFAHHHRSHPRCCHPHPPCYRHFHGPSHVVLVPSLLPLVLLPLGLCVWPTSGYVRACVHLLVVVVVTLIVTTLVLLVVTTLMGHPMVSISNI